MSAEALLFRRAFLASVAGLSLGALAGCGAEPPRPIVVTPPTKVDSLVALVPAAALRFLLITRPREIAQTPFLIPALGEFAPEQNLDAFQLRTGFDLRQLREAVYAVFGDELGGADLWLARHASDAAKIERAFSTRLTAERRREEDRVDVVRLQGKAGSRTRAWARIGPEVVAFQEGGDAARGPVRIATLRALGKLQRARSALEIEPLASLHARFGSAPAIALALGPFDDHLDTSAGTLLSIATGLGAAARPTARSHVGLAFAVAGEFGELAEAASERLLKVWEEVATSTMGKTLGVDAPIEPPLPTHTRTAVALSVEVDEMRLARGLKSLVTTDLATLMKL